MWFSRILHLLTAGPPPFLSLVNEPGDARFRGRYLRIDGSPYTLGQMIGQGDEAMVFELVNLRDGTFDHVVKVCRYAPGSARYERWAVPVRDEDSPYAAVPDVERLPARLVEVPGGVVKIQRYVVSEPATAWATNYPAMDVFRYVTEYGPEHALRFADLLLEMYGPHGVLLNARAISLWYAERFDEAEAAFEEAIDALTAERHTGRLGAMCDLAQLLMERYNLEPPPRSAELVLQLPDGTTVKNIFHDTPEGSAFDDTAQDRPVMLLLEALAEEPYLVYALARLLPMIADAPVGPAMKAVVDAIERVDPEYEELPEFRQLAEPMYRDWTDTGEPVRTPAVTDTPEAPPRLPDPDLRNRYDETYRPEPTRGRQARGRRLAARSHLAEGRLDEAETELRAAIGLDPATLEYRVLLVDLLRHTGRLDEAKSEAEEAVTHFPDDAGSYECLGHICVVRGELRDGLLAFLRALHCEPPQPWHVRVKIGQTYRDLGEDGRALAFLIAAYEEAPGDPTTTVALAQVLRAEALHDEHPEAHPRFQESFDMLTAALAENPDSADLLVAVAQSQVAAGNRDEAITLLVRAVAAAPEHPIAAQFLAQLEEWARLEPND